MTTIKRRLFLILAALMTALVAAALLLGVSSSSTAAALIGGGALLLAGLAAAWALSSSFATPLGQLEDAARRIASGDHSPRLHLDRHDETAAIAEALNAIAAYGEMGERLSAAEEEQAAEILSVMSDGVLVLDSTGRIVRANDAAARLLRAPLQASVGRRFVDVARDFPAATLLRQTVTGKREITKTVEMSGGCTFSVRTVPLHLILVTNAAHPSGDRQVLFLIRDITERLRVERVRRDFVANVSHELKTPLSGMALLASTLERAVVEDPDQARHFTQRLSQEVARLSGLVDDLLTLATYEEDRSEATHETETVDLAALVREVVEGIEPQASGRHLHLSARTAVPVMGRPMRLATLARNLIENAVRFTEPGGNVWVDVEARDDTAVLTVRDDGIGIPRSEQSRIFERFYRVDKARSRATGGTGLGLSIVKHVADQSGGTVKVESLVGVGSTFTVTLPLHPSSAG